MRVWDEIRRRLGRALLWSGVVVAAWGCSHAPPIVGQGYRIDDVEFEGVERFSKDELLEYLFSGETSWIPTTPNYPYDEALQQADRRRIEALYAAFGYHDAEVTTLSATVDHGDKDVDLRIVVDEGTPTLVRRIAVTWAADSAVSESVRAEVEATITLVSGQPLEIGKLNGSASAVQAALLERGYPTAWVTGAAEVDKVEHTADARLEIDPGPFAVIRGVRYEGLEDVPQYMVDRETRFVVGEPFSLTRLRQIEAGMTAMRVFRWVTALLPETVDDDGGVIITVRASEADPQSIRLGLQLTVETIRWQEQLRMDYTHTNLFGHLTRLDLTLVAGWAELPNPWDTDQHGPVARFTPSFTKKGLLEDQLVWEWTPSIELDIQQGYQYYSPSNRIGVSRWLGNHVTLGLSHNFRMVDFFNLTPGLDTETSLLGRDFADPFLLSSFDLQTRVFFVDSIVEPTDGVILAADYAFSNQYIGSDFDFHQITLSARAYWKATEWLQLAARIKTGLILTYGELAGSPFSHKFYLGGSNDVRGWASRRLSPRIEECDANGENCETIPIGGNTMILANLELRWHLFWRVWLVTFADMGDVQRAEATWVPEEWNYTAGAGVRVDTPLGLVRLDFGYRLNDPGVLEEEQRWAIHFGFGETF